MKKRLPTIFLALIFIIGLSLLLYPTVSDWWNSMHQTQAISDYAQTVANMDDGKYDELLQKAREYNKKISESGVSFYLSNSELSEYESLLNIAGDGMMGYIEIQSLQISLPVYHGTSDAVLSVGVGHIEGSSLPVGGEGSHCVLSGHRGLPSAKLFSNLDKMVEGDTFVLHVLDETLTYEVDQIRIVEPQEVGDLMITRGEDYCTLVTCTPYGINTHRLLVRGHRTENADEGLNVRVTSDAIQADKTLVASIVAVPILIVLLIILLISTRIKTSRIKNKQKIENEFKNL